MDKLFRGISLTLATDRFITLTMLATAQGQSEELLCCATGLGSTYKPFQRGEKVPSKSVTVLTK